MTLEDEFNHMTDAAIRSKTRGALKWYLSKIRTVRGGEAVVSDNPDFAAPVRSNHKPHVGGMFQIWYLAKTREKLPYWDAFPLIIPIEFYSDGFLGINLHYLPIQLRIKMLDKLMKYETQASTGGNGVRTYMKLSYPMLKAMKDLPAFNFCLKRYLYTQIKSKVIRIDSSAWREVAFLPTQQFQKQSETVVWADAKRAARRYGRTKRKGKK